MNSKPIPLVDYWRAKAFPDGEPPMSFRAPPADPDTYDAWKVEYDLYFGPIGERQDAAWDEIVREAIAGAVDVFAFDSATATKRQKIEPSFFETHVTRIGPGDPVVIYLDEQQLDRPFQRPILNPPWRDPVVMQRTEAKRATKLKRGRRHVADWVAYKLVYFDKVRTEGQPNDDNVKGWQTQADVIRFLHDLVVRDGSSAEHSTLKEHAREMMHEAIERGIGT